MSPLVVGLLANLGIIATFVSLWVMSLEWALHLSALRQAIVMALFTSTAAVALMSLPFEIQPGIRFDLRAVPIVLGGLFAGPVAAAFTALVVVVYRLFLGGAGVPAALASATMAVAIGSVAHLWLRGRTPGVRDVVLVALATSLAAAAATVFLPSDLWPFLFRTVTLPTALIILFATATTGTAVATELRRRAAEEENRLYRALIDSLPEPMNAKDVDGRFMAANPATATLVGARVSGDLIGKTDLDFYPPDVATRFREDDLGAMASRASSVIEQKIEGRDGRLKWVATLRSPLLGRDGEMIGLINHNRDITDRKRLEAETEAARQRLDQALATMADGFVLYDRDARIVLCNQRYRELHPTTGHLRVPGARLEDILRASIAAGEQSGIEVGQEEAWIRRMRETLREPSVTLFTLSDGRYIEGRARPMPDGGALIVLSDVTAARRAERELADLNAQLAVLARDDGLTGLANRRTFEETLSNELDRIDRSGASLSLLMLDLDNFKAYNDTYGHPAGDACLQKIAEVLSSMTRRPGDLAARYGGEEFVAVLPWTDQEGAVGVAEAIRRGVRDRAIPHAGTSRGIVTISIGVATRTKANALSAQELVERADRALYAAKARGRDRVAHDDESAGVAARPVHDPRSVATRPAG